MRVLTIFVSTCFSKKNRENRANSTTFHLIKEQIKMRFAVDGYIVYDRFLDIWLKRML